MRNLTPTVMKLVCPICEGTGTHFDAEDEDLCDCPTCKGSGLAAPPTQAPATGQADVVVLFSSLQIAINALEHIAKEDPAGDDAYQTGLRMVGMAEDALEAISFARDKLLTPRGGDESPGVRLSALGKILAEFSIRNQMMSGAFDPVLTADAQRRVYNIVTEAIAATPPDHSL